MARANLDAISDFPGLLTYLEEELDWPINEATFEEATFDYTAAELGLKDDAVGGPIEIKQLRKLVDNQPWGVFFLNLPRKKLPQTIVRNILGRLTVKKRQASNDPSRPGFLSSDLLFITSTGAGTERRLSFAHFQDDPLGGNAATLKILGWDGNDTPRRLKLTESTLATKLHWPDNPADVVHWRQQWAEAFGRKDTRAVIRDSKALAKALAALARRIRARATELMAAQTAEGSLVKLHAAFKEALIHDLTLQGFADTYAQTIAYGLLSAAISRRSGGLTQDDVTASVASTSPFLKEMLGTFIEVGGRKSGQANAGLDFDELGVSEVVELLRYPNSDMEAVLADFDRRNPDEDPVIHFYELFLGEYDAAQKVKRGVFYTPRPVVSFIVRSVDEVLRTEFGLADGLASTATWGDVIAATPEIGLPDGAALTNPFVRILDPATGTGTFLVECVDLIYKTMVAKWKAAGRRDVEIAALWNDYVPRHLLPRLTGFELMMAPYAIAHVKLGLKLADTGYRFVNNATAQIYLTNALEPAQDLDMQLAFMSEALAHEAQAANAAKGTRFTVVIGNPPYSLMSANLGLVQRAMVHQYRYVDGEKIRERGALQAEKNLQDDYVKFIRGEEIRAIESPAYIMAMITNSSYLDNPTLRGMRWSLLNTYNIIKLLDLHGSVKRSTGVKDENIFDIQQGVGVSLFIKAPISARSVQTGDLLGTRSEKYFRLKNERIDALSSRRIKPAAPLFKFKPQDESFGGYPGWCPVDIALPHFSSAIITARDGLTVKPNVEEMADVISAFEKMDVEVLRRTYSLGEDTNDWAVWRAKNDILKRQQTGGTIRPILYRPFDHRQTFYSGQARGFLCNPRRPVMRNMLSAGNVSLLTCRQQASPGFQHVLVTSGLSEGCVVSGRTREITSAFPLWILAQGTETRTLPNIARAFAQRVAALTGLAYDDCVEGPNQGALVGVLPVKAKQTPLFAPVLRERGHVGKSFGPRDLFDYIYAVLHSPTYRARYADNLKSDFARIPLPGSRALFEVLIPLGTELVALHLLDADASPILKDPKIRLAGSGEARVAHAPTFDAAAGRVYISASRWFETVPQAAWDFHVGGYQPAQKWLKDRAAKGGKKASSGRVLTAEDILHYRRVIVALTRTAELMPKIDTAINADGGWPGAFRGMTGDVAAEAAE